MELVIKKVEVAISEGNSAFAAMLIEFDSHIIEISHNTTKISLNLTNHAEINLISAACKKLKISDLSDYILMSNAWGCSMCMSTAIKEKNYLWSAK